MNISDLIDPKSIHLDKRFSSVDEILKYVASRFSSKVSVSAEVLYEQLLYREQLGGTCITDGVIIPHTRIDGVDDILIEVIRVHQGSEVVCSGNNQKIRLVFAILSSKKLADEYLKVLRAIIDLLRNHQASLEDAVTADDFFGIIDRAAISVDQHPVAADLLSEALTVLPDTSVSLAVDIMKKNQVEELAVVDGEGTFLGMVDFIDLLKSAFPSYVFKFDDLSFLSEFEPLREFLSRETKGVVKDHLTRNREYEIDADVSYVEVVYKFVRSHQKYVYVISDGKLRGIITVSDLITKLLRS